MLIRYKKAMEKIAMGLLSFMPEQKELKKLLETMQCYEQCEDWQLYLYKKDDVYIGAIGVRIEDTKAVIQHITVIPSYRGEGVGTEMVAELCKLNTFTEVRAMDDQQPFIQKCKSLLTEEQTI